MRTAIIYASTHHGNTKKLVDAIAKENQIDTIDIIHEKDEDLSRYECIGIASGIVFSKYYPQILEYLESKLPTGRKVFFLHTAGDPRENQNASAKKITDERKCEYLGTYFCKGFDTFGPFKIIGGINKKHPDQSDIDGAVKFFDGIKCK
ncbi:flavodoxin [Lachnospiraceae bacterium JC7]|nr:flavodoxin [Lachnospiraceae bacterium JC7]